MKKMLKFSSLLLTAFIVFGFVFNAITVNVSAAERPDYYVTTQDGNFGYRSAASAPVSIQSMNLTQIKITGMLYPGRVGKIIQMVEVYPNEYASNDWLKTMRIMRVYVPSYELTLGDTLYAIWDDNNGNVQAEVCVAIDPHFVWVLCPYVGEKGCDFAIVKVN